MAPRYNPPPNWPRPPEGWTPPPGWQPDPAWGPAPIGWKVWLDEPKKHKGLKILGVSLAIPFLFGIIGALTGSNDDKTSTAAAATDSTPTNSPSATPTETKSSKPAKSTAVPAPTKNAGPGIGDKARDGKFRFQVTKVQCGIKKVGSAYLGKKAQGEFCAVSVRVENISDEAQTMFASNQYLFDRKGRKFSADDEAALYADDSQVMFEEVNPGNSIRGRIYFDVPRGTKPVKMELHDSILSGGVDVALR
jgi:hypothetical protein